MHSYNVSPNILAWILFCNLKNSKWCGIGAQISIYWCGCNIFLVDELDWGQTAAKCELCQDRRQTCLFLLFALCACWLENDICLFFNKCSLWDPKHNIFTLLRQISNTGSSDILHCMRMQIHSLTKKSLRAVSLYLLQMPITSVICPCFALTSMLLYPSSSLI